MKNIFLNTIMFLVFSLEGQITNFEIVNNSGRVVRVYEICQYADSSIIEGYQTVFKGPQNSNKGNGACLHNVIRCDYIALDDSTKDTIYVRSFNYNELQGPSFIVNITRDVKNKWTDFVLPIPRLEIATKNYKRIFAPNDTIQIKLSTDEKIAGRIVSYNRENLTIINYSGDSIKISSSNLTGVRACGGWSIGKKTIFGRCKYIKLKQPTFKLMRQKRLKQSNQIYSWGWKEIR